MSIGTRAAEYHDEGFNCAQSVLLSCAEYIGLEKEFAVGIANGFGGGLRCGEACGAIAGALMAIGCSKKLRDKGSTREEMAELAKEATAAFKQRFDNIRCDDIKGVKDSCDDMIAFAAELAEEIINKI